LQADGVLDDALADPGGVVGEPPQKAEAVAILFELDVVGVGHPVHDRAVRHVDEVLARVVPETFGRPQVTNFADHPTVGPPVDDRHLPLRGRRLVLVVPGPHHAVLLADRVHAQPGAVVTPRVVGDASAEAVSPELPLVEGAGDVVADHRAAVAEVGAHVGAEGVSQPGLRALRAPYHQLTAEVVERTDLLRRKLVGVSDSEPAERHGGRSRDGHGASLMRAVRRVWASARRTARWTLACAVVVGRASTRKTASGAL